MEKIRASILMAALFAGVTLLAACENKQATPPPSQADTPPAAQTEPAPATEPPQNATETPAATTDAPPAEAETPPAEAPAEPQAAAPLPEACEAYITMVTECANKQPGNANVSENLKQQMELTRASWAQLDQAMMEEVCKQASEIFSQSSKDLGC